MERYFEDDQVAIYRQQRAVLVYYYGDVRDRHIRLITNVFGDTHREYNALGYLSVVGEQAGYPSTEQRRRFMKYMDTIAENTITANWLMTRGFKGAITRSLITAMTMWEKKTQTMKVFDEGAYACKWLADLIGEEYPRLHITAQEVIDSVNLRFNVSKQSSRRALK